MNTPWLKSLVFWCIVIGVIFIGFQCSKKSDDNKQSSAIMYERLYQCTRDLKPSHTVLLKHIQKEVHAEMSQQDVMMLINKCRQVNPLKHKIQYIKLIQSS